MTKKRFFTYFGGAFFSYILPLASVGLTYGLYQSDRTFLNYFTMGGLIGMIVIGAFFGKDFLDFVKTIGNDSGSIYVKYSKAPIILCCIAGVLLFACYSIQNLMIVIVTSGVSNFIAVPLKVAHYRTLPAETLARLEKKKE